MNKPMQIIEYCYAKLVIYKRPEDCYNINKDIDNIFFKERIQ